MLRNPAILRRSLSKRGCKPIIALEQRKEFLIGLGLAEPLVGYDMRSDVERVLDGKLKRMRREALLLDFRLDLLDARERAQLPHIGLDFRQFLRDEVWIGHFRTQAAWR